MQCGHAHVGEAVLVSVAGTVAMCCAAAGGVTDSVAVDNAEVGSVAQQFGSRGG